MADSRTMKAGEVEWFQHRFRDLEDNELFWGTKDPNGDRNPVWRKLDDTNAMNLRTRETIEVQENPTVYQKDY
jgi:hypothetical protein